MPLEVVREPNGRWPPGVSGNVEGINQHSARAKLQRRIEKAMVRQMEANPGCAVAYAEAVCRALEDPHAEGALELLKLNAPMLFPRQETLELQLSQPEAEGSSQALLDGLAEDFGSQLPSDAKLVGAGLPIESEPTGGAD